MDYLNQVLGVRTVYLNDRPKSMPNYIQSRYRMQKVRLDGKAAVFAYPKDELEDVKAIKKHLGWISRTEEAPTVLIPEHLSYRQKEYLLREHIPFVVDGKQIYLPFMAVYLQERGDSEKQNMISMLPSAQVLLLYFIYRGCGEMPASTASRDLGFTATSISRASRQLEDMGLIRTQKDGVQKLIISDRRAKELFDDAVKYMNNPVKRTIYVPKAEIKENLLMSGYSALSEYSMINPAGVECFAAGSVTSWEKTASKKLNSTEDQCAVELWRYNPNILTGGRCVDRLSLAISLSTDKDERVEEAVEEMLSDVWRTIDGKRT